MTMEDNFNDPKIDVSAGLRVAKTLEWSHSVDVQKLSEFNIWEFEQRLNTEWSKKDGEKKRWTLEKIMIIVKSKHTKTPRITQSIDDLSEAEFDNIIKIIKEQAEEWKPKLMMKIEITASVDKAIAKSQKRRRPDLSSDPLEGEAPPSRLTKTDKLLDRARRRASALEEAGNFEKSLTDH